MDNSPGIFSSSPSPVYELPMPCDPPSPRPITHVIDKLAISVIAQANADIEQIDFSHKFNARIKNKIKELVDNYGFILETRHLHKILLSNVFDDLEKLELYQKGFFQLIKNYIKDEGDPEELQRMLRSDNPRDISEGMKRIVTWDDIEVANMAFFYVDTESIPGLFQVIKAFEQKIEELGKPIGTSNRALEKASHVQSAIFRLLTGMNTVLSQEHHHPSIN